MSSKTNTSTLSKNWYKNPGMEHTVQFYPDCKNLIENLHEYVATGLTSQANCVVIATKQHIAKLNKKISETIDVTSAQQSGQYLTLDANEALKSFMVNGLPDEKLFKTHIGGLMADVIKNHGRPVRAYGEMVALLWKEGNKDAVMELEKLWNNLADDYDFSLYCAYPELHFILDTKAVSEISKCHNLHVHKLPV